MKKKKIGIIVVAVVALLALIIYIKFFPREFKVGNDEIALRIQLDIDEDIGLLVYDYTIDGHDYSGGTSNADKSKIKHNDEIIEVWDREMLTQDSEKEDKSDSFQWRIRFRIITDYVDPNFENVYPEEITCYLDPIEWTATIGHEYKFTITGNKKDGYGVELRE